MDIFAAMWGRDEDVPEPALRGLEQRVADLARLVGVANAAEARMPGGVEDALARGHKIEAIRLYREATGCGLKKAKEAVEGTLPPAHRVTAMAQTLDAVLASLGHASGAEEAPPYAADAATPDQSGIGDWMEEIRREVRANRKIIAIKVLREHEGCGLREAKEVVDAMEAEMRRSGQMW